MHTFIGGPPIETKNRHTPSDQNEHRPRYILKEYVTAIHKRKLVKNCGAGRIEAPTANGSGIWGGGIPLFSGTQKKIGLSFEMFNFYAFWTLVQEDSTTTVTMI